MTTPERDMPDPRLVEVVRTTQRVQREITQRIGPPKRREPAPVELPLTVRS